MSAELHIQVHIDAEDIMDISDNFPFEDGQSLLALSAALIIIDLGSASDTSYVQDWYLNNHEGVSSFFVVSDDDLPESS